MDFQQTIAQYLPKDLWEPMKSFIVNPEFIAQMPDLVELILRSKSLENNEDKQSWFNLLPLMNAEQVAKLKDILTREKEKIAEIEQKYEEKKTEIKKKYLLKWQNMGYVKKISEIKAKEQVNTAQEQHEADQLLTNL